MRVEINVNWVRDTNGCAFCFGGDCERHAWSYQESDCLTIDTVLYDRAEGEAAGGRII